jgi:hypothetical protein
MQCEICQKEFSAVAGLKSHMRTHEAKEAAETAVEPTVEPKPFERTLSGIKFSVFSNGESAYLTDCNGRRVSKEISVDEAEKLFHRWN